ncbi:MAG: hypothetical protein KIT54_10855 [Phycisphaeraceae bacterium]|nr:hypothetical protein [Phycisphaeraceae bacterium]
MKPSTSRFAAAASLAISSATLAQSSVIIDVADPVLLPGQSTTVTLWAAFPSSMLAMAGIVTDLESSEGDMGWSELRLIPPMNGPGSSTGVLGGTGIAGIIAGQLNFPCAGCGPDGSNPISFWRATFTAPAEVATPFDVSLSTSTSRFDVYFSRDSRESRSFLEGLIEGHATIHIIPAPAGAVVLGLGVLATGRRRR